MRSGSNIIETQFGLASKRDPLPHATPDERAARHGIASGRADSHSDYSEPLILSDIDDLDVLRAARGISQWVGICLAVECAIVIGLLAVRWWA